MKVKTQHCLVTLGPMTVTSKCVWAWEAEVLEEKFGGQCEFTKESVKEISELPDVGGEYSRLQDAHGIDEETKVSHVENTFGRGKAGMKELEKAMEKAIIKPKVAKKKVTKKSIAKKAENKSETDPLA